MNKILVLLVFSLGINLSVAQLKKVDGIAAVIGDEIILKSEIEELKTHYQLQGIKLNSECELIDNILTEKMVLYQAKQDTLIKIDRSMLSKRVDAVIEDYSARAGSLERLLSMYNLQTRGELEIEIQKIMEERYYIDQKKELVTDKVDISPVELREFYNNNKSEFPEIPDEVELAQIVLYPELTEAHKQEYINKLKKIKDDILKGASFEDKALLYTEDPGSKGTGGLYTNKKRGEAVKEFEAVAFNLEEGEISDPVETEFGFHIIKLEKRKGQMIDYRHILLLSKPNNQEIATAKHKLDSIRTLIIEGKLTFKEATAKFSDDKETRYNAGVITDPQTGEDKFDKYKLPSKPLFAIAALKIGEMSDVFEDEVDGKKMVKFLLLKNDIPKHQYSVETDYNRIKRFALQEKKQKELEKYVKSKIPDTFITIQKEFRNCTYSYDWLNEGELTAQK